MKESGNGLAGGDCSVPGLSTMSENAHDVEVEISSSPPSIEKILYKTSRPTTRTSISPPPSAQPPPSTQTGKLKTPQLPTRTSPRRRISHGAQLIPILASSPPQVFAESLACISPDRIRREFLSSGNALQTSSNKDNEDGGDTRFACSSSPIAMRDLIGGSNASKATVTSRLNTGSGTAIGLGTKNIEPIPDLSSPATGFKSVKSRFFGTSAAGLGVGTAVELDPVLDSRVMSNSLDMAEPPNTPKTMLKRPTKDSKKSSISLSDLHHHVPNGQETTETIIDVAPPKKRGRPRKVVDPADVNTMKEKSAAQKPTATRKRKSAGDTDESAAKVIKGRVIKSSTGVAATKSKKKATEAFPDTAIHAGMNVIEGVTADNQDIPTDVAKPKARRKKTSPLTVEDIDLQLDDALPRKMDWTPVKQSRTVDMTSALLVGDTTEPDPAQGFSPEQSAKFSNLVGSFEFSATASKIPRLLSRSTANSEDSLPNTTAAPLKLRKVELELVDLANTATPTAKTTRRKKAVVPKEPKEKKVRAKKTPKKVLTITSLSKAQHGSVDADADAGVEDEKAESSILPYFSPTAAIALQNESGGMLRPKKGGQKTNKAKSVSSKKSVTEYSVLPPEDAQRSHLDQDIIFATSSQLAADEDPEFIRDMVAAIKASENDATSVPERRTAGGSSKLVLYSKKNLWSAANQDINGGVLEAEVLNLVDTPAVKKVLAEGELTAQKENSQAGGWLDIDNGDVDTPPNEVVREISSSPDVPLVSIMKTAEAVPDQPVIATSHDLESQVISPPVVPPSKTKMTARARASPQGKRKPHYEGFTVAELGAKVKKYGFKPVRSKAKMIELLEKCWEDQHGQDIEQGGAKVQDTNVALSEPVKRPRGRPRKDSTSLATSPIKAGNKASPGSKASPRKTARKSTKSAAKAALEEIEDSAAETDILELSSAPATPIKKKRGRPARATTPTIGALELSPATLSSEAVDEDRPDLLDQITRAIFSTPPGIDGPRNHQTHPTFHEKMLMYDSIILEDLATWLNTEGLSRVGEDREVHPVIVREWCEMRGVCCVWRGGWRGDKSY